MFCIPHKMERMQHSSCYVYRDELHEITHWVYNNIEAGHPHRRILVDACTYYCRNQTLPVAHMHHLFVADVAKASLIMDETARETGELEPLWEENRTLYKVRIKKAVDAADVQAQTTDQKRPLENDAGTSSDSTRPQKRSQLKSASHSCAKVVDLTEDEEIKEKVKSEAEDKIKVDVKEEWDA